MKKCCIPVRRSVFCVVGFLSCLFAFALHAQKFPVKDFFYTVPINIQANNNEHIEWWHECMEAPRQAAFFQSLLDLVDSGRVAAYAPGFPYSKKMSREEIHLLLHKTDTIYPDYGYLMEGEGYYVEYHDITAQSVHAISFHEEWQYDGEAKTFLKNVKGIILHGRITDSDFPLGTPLFYIPFDGKGIKSGPAVSNSAIHGFTYDFHTRDYNHVIRPADVLFPDDTTMQKKNQEETKKIISAMLAGKKIIFYDTLCPYTTPLSKKVAAKNLPLYQSANAIRFLEDWNVDLNKMTFTKTVHGIVLEKENEYKRKGNGEFPDFTSISFTRLAFLPLNEGPLPMVFPNPAVVNDFIYRETFFKNPLVYREQTVFTDSAKLMKLCIGICDLAESKKLKAYSAYGNQALTDSAVASLFSEVHKADIPARVYTIENYDAIPFYYPTIAGLGFNENWFYNSTTQTFEKQIQSVTLTRVQWVGYKESYFNLPLFSVRPPAIQDPAAIMKPEFLVARNIQSPVMIDHTRELATSDQPYYPQVFMNENVMESSVRFSFVQQVINAALAGKITAYDGEKRETVLTPEQLRAKIDSKKDSSFVQMDLPTDYLAFQEIVFVEDWYFNPATGAFYKKVNEIIFVNSDNSIDPYRIDFEKQDRVFAVKLK